MIEHPPEFEVIKIDDDEITLLRILLNKHVKILDNYCANTKDADKNMVTEYVKAIQLAGKLSRMQETMASEMWH